MTDRSQFEAMLEALINEDQETAKEIFHNIVVQKSRQIYEELLAEDFSDTGFPGNKTDSDEDSEENSDEDSEEDLEDSEEDSDEDSEEDLDDLEDSDEDLADQVSDLEDALEELKAEFEELMAGEKDESEHDDMFGGGENDAGMDNGSSEMDGLGSEMGDEDELDEFIMEYVNKVSPPKHGDNGVNTKSPVAKANNMGGTTANIARGGESKSGGTAGGLAKPTANKINVGNVNVPGAKRAPKLNAVKNGHGAERSGTREQSVNKRSIVGGGRSGK